MSEIVEQSRALLKLNAAKALSPHGIGNLARDCIEGLIAEITRLRADLVEAREALRPFAEAASRFADDCDLKRYIDGYQAGLIIEELVTAAFALASASSFAAHCTALADHDTQGVLAGDVPDIGKENARLHASSTVMPLEENKMTNVFEGKPDDRQSDGVNMKTSRFRPKYRALTDYEKELHDKIKAKAEELEALYSEVRKDEKWNEKWNISRYNALAITSLEESVMWAIKDLTS